MPTMSLTPPRDWPTLGPLVVGWMEHYLCHGPGDVQGDPLYLNDEAAQFVYDAYRLYPKGHRRAGRRVVTYAGLSEPKGFAKSEIAGALIALEFVGPCRWQGWASKAGETEYGVRYEKGDPLGKPITYPFIRPLATEEHQVRSNTYINVEVMFEHAATKYPREWRFSEIDCLQTRTFLGNRGKQGIIMPSTSGSAGKDGGKESFSVADEPHLYYLPELREMHAMVRRNTRKRREAQPWMLATTTMFKPGQDSVAEDLYEEADKLAQQKKRTFGFLWHHREGFEVTDPGDDDAIIRSLEEAYEPVLDHMDPESILEDEIRAPGSVWADNVRYFINRKHKGDGKAIDPLKWDLMAAPQRTPGPSRQCRILLGFDGSEGGVTPYPDDTALIAWTVEAVPHLFLVDYWEKPSWKRGEWRVPRSKVRTAVTGMREDYLVRRLVMDPPGWREEHTAWEAEFGKDDDDDDIVIEFYTNQERQMDAAIDRFLSAVGQANFTHDGSERLRYYALNAVLATTAGRSKKRALVKEKQTAKIDGLVAAVIGYDELQHLPIDEPEKETHLW